MTAYSAARLSQSSMLVMLVVWTSSALRQFVGYDVMMSTVDEESYAMEYTFDQIVDHFDGMNDATFSQRYFVNQDFWEPIRGPVFLYIGGEGTLSGWVVERGHVVELAKKHHALLIALEHRYYGGSVPSGVKAPRNLRHLSSQQALADIAVFHGFIEKQLGLTRDNKWISFGGSYPGALSAWLREKYPHLVIGAIASSAPVRAVVDYHEYNTVVNNAFADKLVGGSAACLKTIKAVFNEVDAFIDQGNLQQLHNLFNLPYPLKTKLDVMMLLSSLQDPFMGAAQYNGIAGYSIKGVCGTMLNSTIGTPMDRFLSLPEIDALQLNQKSFHEYIKAYKHMYLSEAESSWVYQTCSQFGYFQTCEPTESRCVFSRHLGIELSLAICRDVFGMSSDAVARRIAFSNADYGSDTPSASNIVFVNGDIDPWHKLSVLDTRANGQTAIVIRGGSHCQNMGPSLPTDSTALVHARRQIDAIIASWLQPERAVA